MIHTADIHLDASYAAAGLPVRFGARRRQGLRDVFQQIVRRAGEWPADALLIVGDLFEHDRVSLDTLAFLRGEFASISHVPVFIAPGNHDPYMPDSPYATMAWPDNVVIFSSPKWTPHALDNAPLTVHGFAFDGPDISVNPFGALAVPQDGRLHVAVAHGSENSFIPSGKTAYAPFRAEDAAPDGLAYLALGHYHGLRQLTGDFTTLIYYSGAPEGHSFGETGIHYYLEADIDERTALVTPVASSRAVYAAHSIDCAAFASAQDLVNAVRALPRDGGLPQVTRITLTGACEDSLRNEFNAAYDAVAAEYEFLDLVDATVPREDIEALARENTSLGAFVDALTNELRDTADARRREMLERARAIGIAAYRGQALAVRGAERG
ncbi:MAG: DNA repair exonuclease [Candidatus Hydrogenedentes bacterium]|nr:DNA repair exonuclease [Candidatus Hydrogenedentota bacterium]